MNYVIGELRKIGYNPTLVPYANADNPNTWSERTPSTLEVVTSPNQTTLPNGKTFVNGTAATSDFAQMTWSQTADITAQVIPAARIQIPPPATADTVRSGCSMSDFPAAVKDNIVLVQRGGCTELVKAINARANGAKAVMIMNEGQTGRTASARYVSQTYPGTVGIGVTYALGQQLYEAAQTGPVTLRFKSDNNLNLRIDYDISAETPGGDPTRVLQVGAHIDGVAAGPGINDDGTGTAMNLTIANQIMKLGITLKYKIRFGWFSGEEQGLYGSTFFVNQLNSLQTTQTLAMLDYDMIASTNWIPFMYVPNDVTEPTLPPAQRAAEATLSKIHIDYLKNSSTSAGRLPVRQPVRLRPVAPAVGDPRRARDRLLHRRRGHQDRATGGGQRGVDGRDRRPGRHPGRPVLPRVVRHGVQPEPVRPGRVHRRARAQHPLVRRRRSRRGRDPGSHGQLSGSPGGGCLALTPAARGRSPGERPRRGCARRACGRSRRRAA